MSGGIVQQESTVEASKTGLPDDASIRTASWVLYCGLAIIIGGRSKKYTSSKIIFSTYIVAAKEIRNKNIINQPLFSPNPFLPPALYSNGFQAPDLYFVWVVPDSPSMAHQALKLTSY